jgi:hypothetical protein
MNVLFTSTVDILVMLPFLAAAATDASAENHIPAKLCALEVPFLDPTGLLVAASGIVAVHELKNAATTHRASNFLMFFILIIIFGF